MLLLIFEKIWEQEEIPTDWKDGHIIKLPKKGGFSSREKTSDASHSCQQ
jgi:hypothetical protein